MQRTYLTLITCALAWALTAGASAPAQSQAMPAEYAIRWDVKEGGPKSAQDTLTALQLKVEETDDFEVEYFDIEAPSEAPDGFDSILRQRRKGKKKHELTFKYRGDHALESESPDCPLSPTPDEEKREVDVSILPCGQTKRAFSYSCTLNSKEGPIKPPSALDAKLKSCTSKMLRLKAGKLKVEEWQLPGGVVMVEVSRNGLDTAADLESFQKEVVERLVNAEIKPSDRSKTELGG